jgi:hypothetical protein
MGAALCINACNLQTSQGLISTVRIGSGPVVRCLEAPPTLPKKGEMQKPTAGRGNQMIAFLPGRVCRLRAVRL